MRHPLLCLIILCVLLSVSLLTPKPALAGSLEFRVIFTDAEMLEPGCPVIYKGVRIGAVRDVGFDDHGDVEVKVRIKSKYSKALYREASFKIVSNQRPSGDGEDVRLIIEDQESPKKTRIGNGDRIVVDSVWSLNFDRVAADLSAWFKKYSHELWDDSKDFSASPEGQELKNSLKQLTDQAREMGKDQFDQFLDDEYPKLQLEAESLRDRFMEEGKLEEADEFWQDFKNWSLEMIEEAKKELSESQK